VISVDDMDPAAKLEALAAAFPDLAFVIDEEGYYVDVFVGPETDDLPSSDPSDLVGKHLSDVFPPEKAAELERPLERAVETGDLQTVEYELALDDGRRWFEGRLRAVDMPDSDRRHAIWVARDVTERRRSERRLARERDYRTKMLDAVGDLFFVLDESGCFVDWNESLRSVSGYDDGDLASLDVLTLFPDHEAEVVERTFDEALDAGLAETEANLRTRAGDRIPFEFVVSPFETAGGETLLVGIGREITRRKEREQQVQVLGRVLRHNLRNEMNVVEGVTARIADQVPAAAAEELDQVECAVNDLLSTAEKAHRVADMLDGPATRERVDLTALVDRAVAPYRSTYPDADLALDLPDEAWAWVAPQFSQAVGELVENALEHGGDPATVTVGVERTADAARLSVRDDGPGIPEIELSALRGRHEPTALNHGSGLGLWLVDWVVRRSRGELTFRLPDDCGTVARVDLRPASPPDEE